MPEFKIPVGSSLLIDSDASSIDDDVDIHDKTELSSLRSSSPKSASSASCTGTDDSRSDGSDRSAAAALLEIDETTPAAAACCGLEDDLEASLSLSEDRAEELMRQGADMRHVLCTSWKLQPKMAVGMRLRKGSAASVGGGSGGKALRDAAAAQKKAIIQVCGKLLALLFASMFFF
jgi:hypothetical protein